VLNFATRVFREAIDFLRQAIDGKRSGDRRSQRRRHRFCASCRSGRLLHRRYRSSQRRLRQLLRLPAALVKNAPALIPTPIPAPAVVAAPGISPANARITITLNQIPLGEALRYIASQAGLKVKVEPYAVSIIPISEQSADLITKEYRVPPGFYQHVGQCGSVGISARRLQNCAGSCWPGTGKDTQESTGGHQLVNREGAKEFLEKPGRAVPARRQRETFCRRAAV